MRRFSFARQRGTDVFALLYREHTKRTRSTTLLKIEAWGCALFMTALFFCQVVQASPVIVLTVLRNSPNAPARVEFDASATTNPEGGDLSFAWDFGDGSTGSGARVSHTFQDGGEFMIRLNVSDAANNSASTNVNVIIGEREIPRARFQYSIGRQALEVQFDSSRSYGKHRLVAFEWDFGDGSSIEVRCDAGMQPPEGEPPGPGGPGTRPPGTQPPGPGGPGTRPPGTQPPGPGGRGPQQETESTQPVAEKAEPGQPGTVCRQRLTHTYGAPGNYVVRLIVVDETGRRNQIARQIKVLRNVPVSLRLLPGNTGGTPSSTAVLMAELSSLPIDKVESILIRVAQHDPPDGVYGGLKIDAVVFSTAKCFAAPCAAFLTQGGGFSVSETTLVLPEQNGSMQDASASLSQQPPYGTANGRIDAGIATLDTIDANASRVSPGGFVVLPAGTTLMIRYPAKPIAAAQYLYFGFIDEWSSEFRVDLFDEAVSIADVIDQDETSGIIPEDTVLPITRVIGPGGGLIKGNSVTLWIPPGSLENAVPISLREWPGPPLNFTLEPSIQYKRPAVLFVRNTDGYLAVTVDGQTTTLPSDLINNGLSARLWGHSTFSVMPRESASTCPFDDCWLFEVNDVAGLGANCYFQLVHAMHLFFGVRELRAINPGGEVLGKNDYVCSYPSQLDPNITVNRTGNSVVVGIPQNVPKIVSHVYVPSKNWLLSLSWCSVADAEIAYNNILAHELRHVDITRRISQPMVAQTVEIVGGQVLGDYDLKRVAYNFACWDWIKANLAPAQEAFHNTPMGSSGQIEAGLSKRCKCDETAPMDPLPNRAVCMWEFVHEGPGGGNGFQCRGILSGQFCRTALNLTRRADGAVDPLFFGNPCCWECEQGGNFCSSRTPAPVPGKEFTCN